MKRITVNQIVCLLSVIFLFGCSPKQDVTEVQLAKPSPQQYVWHEQERIMFIHFGMATWQGREYDNFSTDLSRVNPYKLNTDEWCEVALSFGAKQIVFVAKHVGGFCWWPTETTDYDVRHIPWKVISKLTTCAGWGMRICFVPEDEIEDEPEIQVRQPGD